MFARISKSKVTILIIIFFSAIYANAQEIGKPFVRHFDSKEYKGSTQNWAIIQDKRGMIYAANKGVSIYDGTNWQGIENKKNTTVRSLAYDKEHDIVYVGGIREFGFLAPNNIGELQYHEISNQLDSTYKKFTDIWAIYVKNNQVFFQSFQSLIRYTPDNLAFPEKGSFYEYKNKNLFHLSGEVNGTIYIRENNIGIKQVDGDSLRMINGGENFLDKRVYKYLQYTDSLVMMATRERGIYIYNPYDSVVENKWKPGLTFFDTKVNNFIRGSLYSGLKIDDNHFMLSTIQKGNIIFDKQGKILEIIDDKSGIVDNITYAAIKDKSGNIWLGLNNGIAHIEYTTPFRFWDKSNDLFSTTYKIIRHNKSIYSATSIGLFQMQTSNYQPERFLYEQNIKNQTWSFLEFEEGNRNKLLVGSNIGIFEVEGIHSKKIDNTPAVLYMMQSKKNPAKIYGGYIYGVFSMDYDGMKWTNKTLLKGVGSQVRQIAEDEEGNIWLGTRYNGIRKVSFNADTSHLKENQIITHDFAGRDYAVISAFDTIHGLPSLTGNRTYFDNGKLLVGTSKGVYVWKEKDNFFYPIPSIEDSVAESFSMSVIDFDHDHNIYNPSKGIFYLQKDGSYVNEKTFLQKIKDETNSSIYLDENYIWYGGPTGIYRYNTLNNKDYKQQYPINIRKVVIGEDSVIYGGYGETKNYYALQGIDFKFNDLQIYFTSSFFENPEKTEYSFKLKGFKDKWSEWNTETKANFTNLHEGQYNFMVKARNLYGTESDIARFELKITPPYYRTWYAYTFYVLSSLLMIWIVVKIYSRKLIKDKDRLEEIVKERTHEISEKNVELEQQKEEIQTTADHLQQANEEIISQKEVVAKQNRRLEKSYQNIKQLSDIGKEITANLSIESIIATTYEHINQILDATIFSVGLYNHKLERIEFNGTIEKGEVLPYDFDEITNANFLSVRCFLKEEEIVINNLELEYNKYFEKMPSAKVGEVPFSIVYLPLYNKEQKIGVVSVQSFQKNMYTNHHISLLRNIGIYVAIAIENAGTYQEIEKQKSVIERQTDHIKGSIRYAQTIQQAILPIPEIMDTLFNYFVLYRPKDIVSGDFYWVSYDAKSEKIFAAVIDCTGHGVPGAFMSMIGSRLLNDIVNEKHIKEPAQILEEMDKGIKSALKQDVTDNNDGMDICLISINKQEKNATEICFAGAKRPLYIYRNNGEVENIRGNRRSVGGVRLNRKIKFEQLKLRLNKNEVIYLTSDGYIDQNSYERKKFSSKKLFSLIEKVGKENMITQKDFLENELDKHMKGTEQRDDISMLGIKF